MPASTPARACGVSLGCGTLFGAGLAVSGMVDPARIRGFLGPRGRWDPTLAFVMAAALAPMSAAWAVARRRATPLLAERFHPPPRRPVDARLLGGAALFGLGWGLTGLCPGPGLAGLGLRPARVAPFVGAMGLGFALYRRFADATSWPAPTQVPALVQAPVLVKASALVQAPATPRSRGLGRIR